MPEETIVLSPQMASDFEGELHTLADSLQAELPDLAVVVRDPTTAPPGAFGPEFGEVLTVILPIAADYIVVAVLNAIGAKLRGAWRKREDNEPAQRIVKIYGPNGEVLAAVEVPDGDAYPTDS